MNDAELLLTVESRKKSGWLAAILNLILPGAGYVYCGRWFLGMVAFFFVIALFVFSLGYAGVALAIMLFVDGFLCAGRYNKKVIQQVLAERKAAVSAASASPA